LAWLSAISDVRIGIASLQSSGTPSARGGAFALAGAASSALRDHQIDLDQAVPGELGHPTVVRPGMRVSSEKFRL
jgi:hypothetical protein